MLSYSYYLYNTFFTSLEPRIFGLAPYIAIIAGVENLKYRLINERVTHTNFDIVISRKICEINEIYNNAVEKKETNNAN